MDDLNLSWFVRQEVIDAIDCHIRAIAEDVVDQGLDPEGEEAFEIVGEFMNWQEYTDEEFEYLIRMVIAQCTLESMRRKGLVEETDDGAFKMTPLGNMVSAAYEAKHA